MIQQLLAHWLSIAAAQLVGVALAWGADWVSWRARQSAKIALAFNFVVLGILLPKILVPRSYLIDSLFVLVWLLGVTWVQKRQLRLPFGAAFVGASVQLSCFLVVFAAAVWVWIINWRLLGKATFNTDFFNAVWCGSAVLTYLVLSLFRPAISAMWRRNARKAASTLL